MDSKCVCVTLQLILEQCLRWDVDNDGVIENSSFADQTYDAWSMEGARLAMIILNITESLVYALRMSVFHSWQCSPG